LASSVCGVQAIVIRPPLTPGVISCGGTPMTAVGEASGGATTLTGPEVGQALPGKRYVDEATGLEVLCTKGGKGSFAFEGRQLTLKQAKPLPASD
jgi:hypothetical protein